MWHSYWQKKLGKEPDCSTQEGPLIESPGPRDCHTEWSKSDKDK